MRIISLRYFLTILVCLDVISLPSACQANSPVYIYFYLEEDFTSPYPDSPDAYLILEKLEGDLITADEVPNPTKEGYVFLGWKSYAEVPDPVEFDIVVHRNYYQGQRNLMIFYALWEEVIM